MAADQQEEIERQKSQIAFQQQDIDNKKRQIEESKPKVAMYDSVINKLDTFDMATVAKMLNFDGVGRNMMFKILKEQFIFMPDNQPYQRYVDLGYFKVIMAECKDYILRPKTVVYTKGVELIRQKLLELGYKQKKLEEGLVVTGEMPIFATVKINHMEEQQKHKAEKEFLNDLISAMLKVIQKYGTEQLERSQIEPLIATSLEFVLGQMSRSYGEGLDSFDDVIQRFINMLERFINMLAITRHTFHETGELNKIYGKEIEEDNRIYEMDTKK